MIGQGEGPRSHPAADAGRLDEEQEWATLYRYCHSGTYLVRLLVTGTSTRGWCYQPDRTLCR